jgi:hypothetical protein
MSELYNLVKLFDKEKIMAYDKREISGNLGFFDRNRFVDLENSLYNAAREGNLINVKGIVAKMKSLEYPINVAKIVTLNLQYKANFELVEYLLSEGNYLKEYDYFLIYITAAQCGYEDLMDYMDDNLSLRDDCHNYGLVNAAGFGKLNVIEYLLCFPDVSSQFVQKAVIKACNHGHAKIFAALFNCDEKMLLDAVKQNNLNSINTMAENMLNRTYFGL